MDETSKTEEETSDEKEEEANKNDASSKFVIDEAANEDEPASQPSTRLTMPTSPVRLSPRCTIPLTNQEPLIW